METITLKDAVERINRRLRAFARLHTEFKVAPGNAGATLRDGDGLSVTAMLQPSPQGEWTFERGTLTVVLGGHSYAPERAVKIAERFLATARFAAGLEREFARYRVVFEPQGKPEGKCSRCGANDHVARECPDDVLDTE